MTNSQNQKQTLYVLFSCDAHKSYSSMSLIGVFDEKNVRGVIRDRLNNDDDFELGIEDITDDKFNEMSIDDIGNLLDYGFVQTVSLNERLD